MKRRKLSQLRRLLRSGGRDLRLAAEAFLFLGVARFLVRFTPFKFYAPSLGEQGLESPRTSPGLEELKKIRWAIRFGHRRAFFFRAVCLPQAMAGRWMLQRRGYSSTLYLGVTRCPKEGLRAHAWLRCGDLILTGEEGREEFTVVARFT